MITVLSRAAYGFSCTSTNCFGVSLARRLYALRAAVAVSIAMVSLCRIFCPTLKPRAGIYFCNEPWALSIISTRESLSLIPRRTGKLRNNPAWRSSVWENIDCWRAIFRGGFLQKRASLFFQILYCQNENEFCSFFISVTQSRIFSQQNVTEQVNVVHVFAAVYSCGPFD